MYSSLHIIVAEETARWVSVPGCDKIVKELLVVFHLSPGRSDLHVRCVVGMYTVCVAVVGVA